ncbi:PSP1 domain protein [Cordyceps fumosorosea ARSEF 2679]|uniref:PSP1 domain protein n=1 Tax=Cordyceps fumosorosea (strain ARSEF 2679) TaxID=1081104 RepID=A0A167TIC6_CORFA|nr:PSP1 domain protein [Cordyceps fumosorosea ARSEF 2679]OAA60629.1 PSP1 domain protein [Cordyceps fumosorosea ARSEF 2679]
MSSGIKPNQSGKLSHGPGSQNLLLEKVGVRTSTPDSDALASSEDEGDHRQDTSSVATQPHKPVRRSSWLNDTSQPLARPRQGSFASNSVSSPNASHPSTPSADNTVGPWGSHSASSAMPRPPGASSFPWGTGIWNSDRKDPPSRLTEVLPSPTSIVPPGSAGNSFFGPDSGLSQTSPSREQQNSQIPFAIPLHPTPKTYRSQSYSVGQRDLDAPTSSGMSSSAILGRARHHPALQHRPSRPSMLSEMSNDGSVLGKVKEVEDDEEESGGESLQNSFHQTAESKTIEMLTRENALLRQQHGYSRIRPRASTGASYLAAGHPLHEVVLEESDYAIDELDESHDPKDPMGRRVSQRRMSEYGPPTYRTPHGMEARKLENPQLTKALWSSSPGYLVGDASQSRRHSFANMPTRQGSISSIADSVATLEAAQADQQSAHYAGGFQDPAAMLGSNNPMLTHANSLSNSMQSSFTNPFAGQFAPQNQFQNRPPSPRHNMYGIAPPRLNQLLHVVLFKCARADVFYIQEGTGLTVKPGDLVIVEADRGTDLGTVAKDNVDWQTAKDLKEHYAEEQYKWLMMYSQGAAAAQEGNGGMLSAAHGLPGSAVGGMGPAGQHHMQEPANGEIRPKLIKRLAQNHEVHALRDKEGQEAKAKRVCMQKVKEHGLNMEILDAEFQMDWKKLTFYYFADAYINFNSLVTDLFKIYKTRIWMSAINPASFASPTLGIQAPSGVGPGAVNQGRASTAGDRRGNTHQHDQQQLPPVHPTQAISPGPQGRGLRAGPGGYNQPPMGMDRHVSPVSATGFPNSNYAFGPTGAFGNARPPQGPYHVSPSPGMEGVPAGFQHPGDFQTSQRRFQPGQPEGAPPHHLQRGSPISSQGDWATAFQGLSLNTH